MINELNIYDFDFNSQRDKFVMQPDVKKIIILC